MREIDITGQRFGTLVAIGKEGKTESGICLWLFECDCGNTHKCTKHHIMRSNSSSCGECSVKRTANKRATHGRSRKGTSDKAYTAWCKVKERCFNPNTESYRLYENLDVKMEPEWVEDFSKFLDHIGDPPSSQYSVDRKDNSLGYVRGNVRWADHFQQARNRGMCKLNKSGVTGVSFSKVGSKGRYVASWRDLSGKLRCKYFSVSKYGDELAFFMACEQREHQIMLLNLQGAGYSDSHGKQGYSARCP